MDRLLAGERPTYEANETDDMALNARTKRKHIEAAVKFIPVDEAHPLDYAAGGGGAWSPSLLTIALLGGWVVVTILLLMALHSFIIIGILPVAGVFFALNQPRGVLLTDHGVAALHRNFLNSRPDAIVGLDSAATLDRAVRHQVGYTKIHVATSTVWLKDSDLRRLRQCATHGMA